MHKSSHRKQSQAMTLTAQQSENQGEVLSALKASLMRFVHCWTAECVTCGALQLDPQEAQIAALKRELFLLRQENVWLRDQVW